MASIVACGSPEALVHTESRDCVSARLESSAKVPVARKSAAISAIAPRRQSRLRLGGEIRSSEGVVIVHLGGADLERPFLQVPAA